MGEYLCMQTDASGEHTQYAAMYGWVYGYMHVCTYLYVYGHRHVGTLLLPAAAADHAHAHLPLHNSVRKQLESVMKIFTAALSRVRMLRGWQRL